MSRIHFLRSFPKGWFVLRDDELSFSISGSKLRKYEPLLSSLEQQGVAKAVVVGGESSNNVVGLSQKLIERGITPYPLVLESRGEKLGNAFLLSLLVPEERITRLTRSEWPNRMSIAKTMAEVVIPEGAFCAEAIEGAMSLAKECEGFDHVWIDAGTGCQAIGLLKAKPNAHVHIVQLADDLSELLAPYSNYTLYRPSVGKSFGSVPKTICSFISTLAQEEGFFTDPIYSGKLFYTAREHTHLPGKHLIVHSGGGMGLLTHYKRFGSGRERQ